MNQNEFVQLVTPFKDKVFRMAKRLLVSTEEAEDATQEVLVKLWTKSDRLNDLRSVEAMAMTMTKNYCLDQLKSKRAGNLTLVHSNYTDREASLQQKVEDRDSMSWVEKIINEASKNALRCFELQSGSPLTESEKNAKTEKEFNSECPWMYYTLINP